MQKHRVGFAAVAALATSLMALAPAARAADPLITEGTDEGGQGFVQVNGTPGNDTILMASTADGGIVVVRLAGGITVGYISPELVQTQNIVVLAGDGNDIVSAAAVVEGASLEIHGGNGNDTIVGSAGSDLLLGEAGDDTVSGGPGAGFDTISGGWGYGDRLYAGPGGASITDEDGVAEVRGSDSDDSIAIQFAANWTAPDGSRSLLNAISGAGGNDYVFIFVGDEDASVLLSIDGDGQGTLNPGADDELFLSGNVDLGSTFTNFEVVDR